MNWIYQTKNYGLGNFVNLTPTINKLYQIHKEPIPVYFETDYVKEVFDGCEQITILKEKPTTEPMFTSGLTNKGLNIMPDYAFVYKHIIGQPYDNTKGFIQRRYFLAPETRYAVFVLGSGNESEQYLKTKEVDTRIVKEAINAFESKGYLVVFVGSENDLRRNELAKGYYQQAGNIQAALAWIENAAFVVGNDTGLIHVAGVLDKDIFALFKDTELPRCQNMSSKCRYLGKDNWHHLPQLISTVCN